MFINYKHDQVFKIYMLSVNTLSLSSQVIQYHQEQSNLAFLLLVKSQLQDEPLDLDEMMMYCLMPVPPSIGTPDVFFFKRNKTTILHYLLEESTPGDQSYPVMLCSYKMA
jgi:hypothetical protein